MIQRFAAALVLHRGVPRDDARPFNHDGDPDKTAHFAFAEMVALLCAAKKTEPALRLERLWNTLAARHHMALYCACSLECLATEPELNALSEICAAHSTVLAALL